MTTGDAGKEPGRDDYIDYALDGLRRTSTRADEERWGDISQAGIYANFAGVIAWLHQQRGKDFADPDAVANFIRELAQKFADP